jgi:HSP20 family protein
MSIFSAEKRAKTSSFWRKTIMAMYLTRKTRDPFSGEFLALNDAMNQLMRNAFISPNTMLENGVNGNTPALDISETKDAYTVKAQLPGWKPEDVDITFENGQLTLRGEWKDEKEENEDKGEEAKWHRREIRYSSFERSLMLPVEIEADKAQAHFENGVLTLSLPKAEVVKPKQIKIAAK